MLNALTPIHSFVRFVYPSTSTMKFCANISTMFNDLPTLKERYEYVSFKCPVKFEAIECQDPYLLSIEEWQSLFASCTLINGATLPKWELINSIPLFKAFPGNSVPSFEDYKRVVLDKTLSYAKFLDCSKVHLILGDAPQKAANPDEVTPFVEKMTNLLYQSANYLGQSDITCVIEPLSMKERDKYYLRSYKLGYKIVNNSKSVVKFDNVRLLTDFYHLQRVEGNLTEALDNYKEYTGHVQISQVPLRDGPFNEGELNYNFVLKMLQKVYHGYVGLEYFCKVGDDLTWITNFTN